jgi:hypothetical protein
VTVCEPGAA